MVRVCFVSSSCLAKIFIPASLLHCPFQKFLHEKFDFQAPLLTCVSLVLSGLINKTLVLLSWVHSLRRRLYVHKSEKRLALP